MLGCHKIVISDSASIDLKSIWDRKNGKQVTTSANSKISTL